ncbi:twin-arginine translocase subunit TatC, partial [Nanoarchaeota archaeon]
MRTTVVGHLAELRKRLVVLAIFFIGFSVLGIYLSGWFMGFLQYTLVRNVDVTFVSLSPFEFIATQIKLGVFIGLLLSIPVFVWQLALFVRPGLRRKERKYLYTAVPASLLLFV